MHPRNSVHTGKNWKDAAISRALGAHNNSWEAFIGFSAAVLMAIVGQVEVPDLLLMVNAFLWIRIVYVPVYVFSFNTLLSTVRSAVFVAGLAVTLKIMQVSAGW